MALILVDQDLCNRCGICSLVCPVRVIDPVDELTLPRVPQGKDSLCIRCGHCEVTCPSGALVLTGRSPEGPGRPATPGIPPETLGTYLKSRRSVRHFKPDPVDRQTIEGILDIARYAPSGGNRQPVEWLVLHDPAEVRRIAELTMEWIRGLAGSSHPMGPYAPVLSAAWEGGEDVICRGAPHLLIPHIPAGNPMALTDAIIALTHVDIAAPSFGVGTCWAGFVAIALAAHPPVQENLALPAGRVPAYAMMLGYPGYRMYRIPERNPLRVTWR
jgi:nitroreductase/NAD-dependent dihydropyrimidine dehydrogenase PreA subunit